MKNGEFLIPRTVRNGHIKVVASSGLQQANTCNVYLQNLKNTQKGKILKKYHNTINNIIILGDPKLNKKKCKLH